MEGRPLYDTKEQTLSGGDFKLLSEFISTYCGIKMPFGKKVMLQARLQKRLRCLGMASFHDYCNYLFSAQGSENELIHMLDAVTTNKTDFFREPVHFEFLVNTVLPEYISSPGSGGAKPFRVWSAGCSSGEEPYTLAMLLSEFASQSPDFSFSILATDISTKILDNAKRGIYDEDRAAVVPLPLKKKYLMRSKDRSKPHVRIVPELRFVIKFARLNLMDEHYPLTEPQDVIFCRNVIIYFDRTTQERLLSRLCRYLKTDGYLFLGHSESVHGFDLPLARVSSTIYRKIE